MNQFDHLGPLIIGLTGSIGSGKSTVSEILHSKHKLPILDADVLAREVVQPGSDGLQEIVSTFGDSFILTDGSLDRAALGKHVFAQPNARATLEKILHPRIRRLYLERLHSLVKTLAPSTLAIIYVVPLLFESKYEYPELERIVCVYAPESVCVARVMKRNQLSETDARTRYHSQLSMEEKKERADYVIHNHGTLDDLSAQVHAFVDWLEVQKAILRDNAE